MKQLSAQELFDRAYKGDISILSDVSVSKARSGYRNTPLHWLAHTGKAEVLKHPDVDKVKNNDDKTPFDILCHSLKSKYSRKQLKFILRLIRNKKND